MCIRDSPVRYAFIDMRDMERRAFLCREELRLNRRFAPELYLEVCVITGEAGGARIGGQGQIIEYAARMRQFDRDSELDQLLEAGRVQSQQLKMFGRTLADIHAGLPIADSTGAWGDPTRIRASILQKVSEYEKPYRALRGEAEFSALKAALETRLREAQQSASRANIAVSYTHLDVYKRQVKCCMRRSQRLSCRKSTSWRTMT